MPFRSTLNQHVSKAGFGKPGWCSLCAFKDELALNDRIASGFNARQINDWLRTHYDGLQFDRQTIYKHKREHIGHPEDRVVSYVNRTKAIEPSRRPRVASNEQFLEAVRDVGYQRAIDHPDEITVDHALKAAQILASQKSKGGDTLIILAKIMTGTGEHPYEVIEGEYTETEASA